MGPLEWFRDPRSVRDGYTRRDSDKGDEGVGGMIRREADRVGGRRERAIGGVRANAGDGEGRVPLEFDEQDKVYR